MEPYFIELYSNLYVGALQINIHEVMDYSDDQLFDNFFAAYTEYCTTKFKPNRKYIERSKIDIINKIRILLKNKK